jgi:hypothetical protein
MSHHINAESKSADKKSMPGKDMKDTGGNVKPGKSAAKPTYKK